MAFGTITASFLNFLPTPALDCERHRRRIPMLAGFFADPAVVDVCLYNEMRRTSLFLGLSSQFESALPQRARIYIRRSLIFQ